MEVGLARGKAEARGERRAPAAGATRAVTNCVVTKAEKASGRFQIWQRGLRWGGVAPRPPWSHRRSGLRPSLLRPATDSLSPLPVIQGSSGAKCRPRPTPPTQAPRRPPFPAGPSSVPSTQPAWACLRRTQPGWELAAPCSSLGPGRERAVGQPGGAPWGPSMALQVSRPRGGPSQFLRAGTSLSDCGPEDQRRTRLHRRKAH